jgi:fumarate reductase flavoprotein subunit
MSEVKRVEADVVIVAGGMSGLCAAVAAAEKDASVIVFEKSGTVGGAANMGMGFFGVESHIQKKQLDYLTVEEAFNIVMEYTHWKADANLVRKIYGQSGDTIKWVEDMGVEWMGAYKYFKDSQFTWHLPKIPGSNKPAERSGSVIVKALSDRARELGVEFYLNTPVKSIIREGNRVSGVTAVSDDGTEYIADCDAVIVCTGGFGDNPQMIKENLGYNHGEDLFSFRIPGLEGEGMKMVWAVGGGRTPMNIEMTYEAPGFPGGNLADSCMRQPNLMVNLDGRRFINEAIMCNTPHTGNAICQQKQRSGFVIVTDEILDSYKGKGLDYVSHHKGGITNIDGWREHFDSTFAGMEIQDEERIVIGAMMGLKDPTAQYFFQADSIEELAEKTGINKAGLVKTVEEYNAMCDCGRDTLFFKDARYLRPIRGKKFYAMRFFPAGYGSLGGIKVDDNLRVVTQEGEPIPGLYSAGTDCLSIFGDTYCFYLPGSTMGYAVNSGRLAGYNAIDYIDSDDFVED